MGNRSMFIGLDVHKETTDVSIAEGHRGWLTDLSFPTAPQHITLQEYRDTIDETERRIAHVTGQLRQLTSTWRWSPRSKPYAACRLSPRWRWSPNSEI